jgi:hypothetical protein
MPTAKRAALFGVAFILILLAIFALYIWLALHWNYSEGERAGYVQKFSKKGWVCKTWEGELALITLPGAVPEKFEFTVRDDQVEADINKLVGTRVTMNYEQHKGLPGNCLAETEYFITSIKSMSAQGTYDNLIVH